MSEDTVEEVVEQETPDVEAIQQQLDNLSKEHEAMRRKNAELLDELKKNKEQRRQAIEEAEQTKKNKLKESGEFEQLYQSAMHENEALKSQIGEIEAKANLAKKQAVAMQIATDIANPRDIENLSLFIEKRLNADGTKVLDADGQLTVSTHEQLKAEFLNSDRYASMLRGNQSSGGGAPGAKGSAAGSSKKLSRSSYEELNQKQKNQFLEAGGVLYDD